MTDNNHPITPPPELVRQWAEQMTTPNVGSTTLNFDGLVAQAARWGADQELEACCEHLKRSMSPRATVDYLRAARRPKPPSLKEQAIETLHMIRDHLPADMYDKTFLIRSALESLPD